MIQSGFEFYKLTEFELITANQFAIERTGKPEPSEDDKQAAILLAGRCNKNRKQMGLKPFK